MQYVLSMPFRQLINHLAFSQQVTQGEYMFKFFVFLISKFFILIMIVELYLTSRSLSSISLFILIRLRFDSRLSLSHNEPAYSQLIQISLSLSSQHRQAGFSRV